MQAKNYAQALRLALHGKEEKEKDTRVSNFLKILKQRGHFSLLPQVIHILETEAEHADFVGRLKIARMSDKKEFQERIEYDASHMNVNAEDLKVDENDNLVGGYAIETRDKLADRTYKSKLLGLYRVLTV